MDKHTATEVAYHNGYAKGLEKGYEAGKKAIAEELIEILETAKEDPVSDWHCGYFAAYDDVILMLMRKAGLE